MHNGCTGTVSGTISEPTPLNATSSVTDETIGLDGAINILFLVVFPHIVSHGLVHLDLHHLQKIFLD